MARCCRALCGIVLEADANGRDGCVAGAAAREPVAEAPVAAPPVDDEDWNREDLAVALSLVVGPGGEAAAVAAAPVNTLGITSSK